MKFAAPLILAVVSLGASLTYAADDNVLRAMRDELQRSMTLQFNTLEKPYYMEYAIEDGNRVQITGMLDGIVSMEQNDYRIPRVRIRVGRPEFDNTNYVGSRLSYAGRYGGAFPLDDDYAALRHAFWLTTDNAYKSALEAISRKYAALKNMSITEELADFSAAKQAKMVLDFKPVKIDPKPWEARVKELSSAFLKYPELHGSAVSYSASDGTRRLVTSEGGELRLREVESQIRLQTSAQAKDGMTVRDAVVLESLSLDGLPSQPELMKAVEDLGATVTALAAAPRGDDYTGPVLFEGRAAAQILAELLGRNLGLSRKPVSDSGRGSGFSPSELEGRIGTRILPESFSVVDDPTLKEWKGHPLFGTMLVDEDGVEPHPLTLVEKGKLKGYLLTRQPVRGFPLTNGRARLQGNFGDSVAGITNMIVQSSETVAAAEMKSKMIEILKQRDKPFGMIVRKMDFPSSGTGGELQRLMSSAGRSGGHVVSMPLRIYRVYPDGREEMIRGVHFRAFNVRSLKDIIAAGDDMNVFNFLENGQPFAMLDAGSETAESSVVAPSLLIDDLELVRMEDEQPKLPIVPPPHLSLNRQ
jgi:TldD protein